MCIGRDEEASQLIERHCFPANVGKRTSLKFLLDRADGAAYGVKPQQEAPRSVATVQLVTCKECGVVVGYAPVSRIEQQQLALELPRVAARVAYARRSEPGRGPASVACD